MSKADVVFVILCAGATLYATFGGADFGAGMWQLLAIRSPAELRSRIDARVTRSLGPVWEANHVWLIFALVVLWSAFPGAFGPIMEALYVPLALAAVGIVLRGSGFAFGHVFTGRAGRRSADVFAVSSLITPFFMGCAVGAIAAGDVSAHGGAPGALDWVGPLPLVVGALFVASCAYIAAVFLLDDCRRAGEEELAAHFKRRSILAAVVAGVLAAAGIVVLRADARYVFDGLVSEGLPFVIASALLGAVTIAGLLKGWSRTLRPLAIGTFVMVIAGYAVAQYPYVLPTSLTVEDAAGVDATLTAVIVVFCVALVTVVPALVLLYRLAQKQALE